MDPSAFFDDSSREHILNGLITTSLPTAVSNSSISSPSDVSQVSINSLSEINIKNGEPYERSVSSSQSASDTFYEVLEQPLTDVSTTTQPTSVALTTQTTPSTPPNWYRKPKADGFPNFVDAIMQQLKPGELGSADNLAEIPRRVKHCDSERYPIRRCRLMSHDMGVPTCVEQQQFCRRLSTNSCGNNDSYQTNAEEGAMLYIPRPERSRCSKCGAPTDFFPRETYQQTTTIGDIATSVVVSVIGYIVNNINFSVNMY